VTIERRFRIQPAWDCLKVQPCVHGRPGCGTHPLRSCGRHNAELRMCVLGPAMDLTLMVYTGWYLPETGPAFTPGRFGLLVWHAPTPRSPEQLPISTPCERGWTTCYSIEAYSAAQEPIDLLIREGSNAAWEWLEQELASEQKGWVQ
jgi:hypothetical protein